MRDKKQELEIINFVLDYMGNNRPYAAEFIFEITNTESQNFKYSRQRGKGPAVGEIQMEMATYYDILDNYVKYRSKLTRKFEKIQNPNFSDEWNLRTDKKIQYFMCNCFIMRIPAPIPSTKKGRSLQWKKNYNTELGKGTPEHYMDLNS